MGPKKETSTRQASRKNFLPKGAKKIAKATRAHAVKVASYLEETLDAHAKCVGCYFDLLALLSHSS